MDVEAESTRRAFTPLRVGLAVIVIAALVGAGYLVSRLGDPAGADGNCYVTCVLEEQGAERAVAPELKERCMERCAVSGAELRARNRAARETRARERERARARANTRGGP